MSGFKKFMLAMSTKEAFKKLMPTYVTYIGITLLVFMSGFGGSYLIAGLVLYIISTILVIVKIVITARNIMKVMFYE